MLQYKMSPRRCVATVKAKTLCDLFVLEKSDFSRILQDSRGLMKVALERYNITVSAEQLMSKD